jgi:hypothetical protein
MWRLILLHGKWIMKNISGLLQRTELQMSGSDVVKCYIYGIKHEYSESRE